MSIADVKQELLDRVEPDAAERQQNQELFDRINAFIADEFELTAGLMGSTAKDTFISGDKDLDIFVFFDPDVSEEELEEQGLAIGEAVFDAFDGEYAVEYAAHPYTKGVIDGYDVEIIPAYQVESGAQIQSAVDRTPFHTAWVNDTLSAEEKREVIVLKTFLRGQELYGSTLKVEGFSGYLCELLIAEYGSFEAVLEAAARDWSQQEVLDPAEHHETLPNYLKQKFAQDSLIVIDPVDPERNVAAVLSDENYARFIYAAWCFLQAPGIQHVFPEQTVPSAEEVADAVEERGVFLVVTFPVPDLVDDILYPQLRKLGRRLEQVLESADFRLFAAEVFAGEQIRLVFELYDLELPPTRKQRGPRVFHNETHLEQFSAKYDEVWVEDDRLVAFVDRDHTDAADLVEDFFSGDLREKGVPAQLVPVAEQATVTTTLPVEGESWRRFLRTAFHIA